MVTDLDFHVAVNESVVACDIAHVPLDDLLSQDPLCGDLIEGTGGARKFRFGTAGRGKSGGARIVHFYYNEGFPVFLLTCFGKNEKSNLTKSERNALHTGIQALKKELKKRAADSKW